MKHIGMTQSDTILIEMTVDEWQSLGALPCNVELLAAQIRAFRGLHNMSQVEFAARAGISRNYLSMIETDKEPNLSMDVVWRIREAIDQP